MGMTYDVILTINDTLEYIEVYDWCIDNFGPLFDINALNSNINNYRWSINIMSEFTNNVHYSFVNKDDATIFKLRWLNS